jgi:hypothetical protein
MKVLSGEDCFDTWSRVINTMIKLEGLSPNWRALTYEETLAMSKVAIEKAQGDDEPTIGDVSCGRVSTRVRSFEESLAHTRQPVVAHQLCSSPIVHVCDVPHGSADSDSIDAVAWS